VLGSKRLTMPPDQQGGCIRMSDTRVLIVGAGIAGLALAKALHERDIASDVVERAADWSRTGTGLFLPANAVRALRELGLADAIDGTANRIRRQRILDHRGRLLADIDVDRIWGDVGQSLAVGRAELHDALRRTATEIPVRRATTVVEIRDRLVPEVTLSDGSTGMYDLVVGADGIHSDIRSKVFGDAPARYAGQVCWRFIADGFPGISDWTVRLARGRTFLTVALPGGRVYCYADLTSANPSVEPPDDWRDLFADFADPVSELLEQGAGAHFAMIEEVIQPRWVNGRAVLIGDAAHASSPNMAQGAAMALEDAWVLADLLDSSQSIGSVLTAYQTQRRQRVSWVQSQTHRRDRLRGLPSGIRNLALRLAGERIFASNYGPLRSMP
jgi:2-polyprenyl-6-methoxyphenol hydroxylase-like FAD-dependent oxidoreductase